MNDWSKFSEEEIAFICDMQDVKIIKQWFQKNPKTFHKLSGRGFRAETLPKQKAIDIICSNIGENFISDLVKNIFDLSKSKIEEEKEQYINSGVSPELALVRAVASSKFSERPDLFLKLTKECSEDYVSGFCLSVDAAKELNRFSENAEEQSDATKELALAKVEIEELTSKLNSLQTEHAQNQSDFLSEMQKSESEKIELQEEISRLNAEISEINATNKALENQLKKRTVEETVVESNVDISNGYAHTSVCKVIDYYDEKRLLRCADIVNGEVVKFQSDTEKPKRLENKDRLHSKYYPNEYNYYRIWNWNVVVNKNNPEKDYDESSICNSVSPVEIFELAECFTINDIARALVNGILKPPISDRTLYCCKKTSNVFIGLLCTNKERENKAGKVTVKNNVMSLPVYEVSSDDIIELDQKRFYRYIFLGKPNKYCMIFDKFEAVKKILLEKASWNTMKTIGLTRGDWGKWKDFFNGILEKNLYDEIVEKCCCTEAEAQQYVDDFIANSEKYLSGDDIESTVLLAAVQNNKELFGKCVKVVSERWENENREKILSAKNELERFEENAKAVQEKIRNSVAEREVRIQSLDKEINEKQALVQKIGERVSQKISEAREDASKFISEMAFVSAINPQKNANFNIISGRVLDEANLTDCRDISSALKTIADELAEAGVDIKYVDKFSAFLFSAFMRRIPVLLAGPDARNIADAFSVSLFGKTAAYIECDLTEYSGDVVDKISKHNDDIVVLSNAFSGNWMCHIDELLSVGGKYLFFTNPFIEDLLIEPKGILNYMSPIFTERIVSDFPTNEFVGGRASDDVLNTTPVKRQLQRDSVLSKLELSMRSRKNLLDLFSDTEEYFGGLTVDEKINFGYFPYAYISGKIEELTEVLDKSYAKV